MALAVLLWDFGDTLVDERWMRRAPGECPAWEHAWVTTMAELADGWNDGSITSAQVFDTLSAKTGMTTAAVEAHARDCCRQIEFHPAAWRIARERRLPQALVTVNPDLFAEYIVAVHGLTEVFDEIVVSATEGTVDKVALCDTAIERLGQQCDRSSAVLIDNRQDLVEAWQHAGGAGYWYRSDAQFASDVRALLPGPVT